MTVRKRGTYSAVSKVLLAVAILAVAGSISGLLTIAIRPSPHQEGAGLVGEIVIDGSSTVYLITEAVAEEFMKVHPEVSVSVGISGTGGGFKRFVIGETDINDASRRIKEEEAKKAQVNRVSWIEIPIAIDGLSVVVNKENDWVNYITIEELREIWRPRSKVELWSDVRPEWPKRTIALYGPGPDSGTFEFFTKRVVGKAGASRTDYVASEDDNVLVAGVMGEKYSLAYFGYAYYLTAKERIKALAVDAGKGPVAPTYEAIKSFKYPLARPLFIYVNEDRFLERPELREFVMFYLKKAPELVPKVGYIPFSDGYYEEVLKLLEEGKYEGLLKLAKGG